MTIEASMFSMQQVMLERGLDLTVCEVRLGIMENPINDKLDTATCEHALILNNYSQNLRLEMIPADPTALAAPSTKVACIDRTASSTGPIEIENGKNNELMMLRVCTAASLLPVLVTH